MTQTDLDAPTPLGLETPYTGFNIAVNTPPPSTNEVSKYLIADGVVVDNYHALLAPVSVTLAAIPEPTAWILLIGGFAGAGAALRRARRRAPTPLG